MELAHWLRENQAGEERAVLLHNDFKLDNVLIDAATLAPLAVLDPGDPPAMHRMAQMPTAQPGFPTREQAALRYAQALGRDLSGFRFHRVLAQMRTAVIFQQLHTRWRRGETHDPRYAGFGELGEGLLCVARSIAAGEMF